MGNNQFWTSPSDHRNGLNLIVLVITCSTMFLAIVLMSTCINLNQSLLVYNK